MQLDMGRPITLMAMSGMVSPTHGAQDHEFGVVVVVTMAEDSHGAVVARGDIFVEFLAEFADCWGGREI